MTDPTFTASMAAAGVAGLVGSLHCFGMCGPLACAAAQRGTTSREKIAAAASWQSARILAYSVVGALLGGLGEGASGLLAIAGSPVLPWALAAVLVMSALPWKTSLADLPWVGRARRPLVQLGAKFSPPAGASVWGALTPLLPCGLLYGMLATTTMAGSSLRGAAVIAAFGLGSVPALAVAQAGWLKALPSAWQPWLRRGLPVLAAAVLVWRALHAGQGDCCAHEG